jgi:hypothetical protein
MEAGSRKLYIPNVICLNKQEQKFISIKMWALTQGLFFGMKKKTFKETLTPHVCKNIHMTSHGPADVQLGHHGSTINTRKVRAVDYCRRLSRKFGLDQLKHSQKH